MEEQKIGEYLFLRSGVAIGEEPSIGKELYRAKLTHQLIRDIEGDLRKAGMIGLIKPKFGTVAQAIRQNLLARLIMGSTDLFFPQDLDPATEEVVNRLVTDTFTFRRKPIIRLKLREKFNQCIELLANYEDLTDYEVVVDSDRTTTYLRVDQHCFELLTATYGQLLRRASYGGASYGGASFGETSGKSTPVDSLIVCLLLRYQTLGSGGHQWAMPAAVKGELRKSYGINFECFASAFNCYYDNYCSRFYDIERFFGSLGPFQGITFESGFYLLNPPYVEETLITMVAIMLRSLASQLPLAFIFGLPQWKGFPVIQEVETSEYLTQVVRFGAGTTKWFDYLTGTYQTIIGTTRYVLQNPAGEEKWDVSQIGELLRTTWR